MLVLLVLLNVRHAQQVQCVQVAQSVSGSVIPHVQLALSHVSHVIHRLTASPASLDIILMETCVLNVIL